MQVFRPANGNPYHVSFPLKQGGLPTCFSAKVRWFERVGYVIWSSDLGACSNEFGGRDFIRIMVLVKIHANVRPWIFGATSFKDLQRLLQNRTSDDYDLMITCMDEQYQRLDFSLTYPSEWVSDFALDTYAHEYFAAAKSHLGKVMTPEELRGAIAKRP